MTGNEYVTVVHPAAEGQAPAVLRGARLARMNDAVVGLIDNARHNSDRFMKDLEGLLAEAGAGRVIVRRKSNPSVPLKVETLDELAATCDAVIHGVAD